MSNVDIPKLRAKILEGMKISSEKLRASKKLLKQPMVISENRVIKVIQPEDIK